MTTNHESIGSSAESQLPNQPHEDPEDFYEFRARQDAAQAEQQSDSPERDANFKKLINFLDKDISVKEALSSLAPIEADSYGGDGVAYADKLYQGLADISYDLESIMRDYYPSDDIDDRLAVIKQDVANSGADFSKLSAVYQRDFSDMSESFVRQVQEQNKGYYLWRDPHSLDQKAKSINEILHLIHSSIVNDENILQSLPILAKNESNYEPGVTLYGTPETFNPIAKDIYDGFKDDPYAMADIVSIKDRYYVKYFVPKICNVDKVNRLPGVRHVAKKEGVSQAQESTTGIFSLDSGQNIAEEVLNLIAAVPTDADINWGTPNL
jgi:hypothetical protein